MPLYNVTVDDVSAIFQYYSTGAKPWTDSPTSDQELHSYWDSTYHSSNYLGSQASLRFQGTAVYLFAAKRSKHGSYEIYLDGEKVYDGSGYSATPLYNEYMYNATGLSPTWHNLTIRNSDPSNTTYTEVDYVRWTTLMPESLAETFGTTIPYSANSMSYSSLNAWKENTEGSNPSMATGADGASVNITFNGNGIELYGKRGPAYGVFSAQVDGYDEQQLNANSEQVHDTLLFRQDNLTAGRHSILVTNRGTNTLAITSAKPILWRDPNSPSSSGSDGQSSSHSVSTGLIAGVVVGVVVGMAALVFLLLFLLRRRRNKQRDNDNRVHSSHEPAFLDATPFELPASSNEHSPYIQSAALARPSKHRNESSQYPSYPFQPVLGSPGMSSRGSFDTPHGLGVPGSSTGGSSSGRPTSSGSKHHHRPSEPSSRGEIPEGVQVIHDSDAGPILLPPAYSAAMEAGATASFSQSVSSFAAPVAPTPVSTTPVPPSTSPALPPGAASSVMPNSKLSR
ncbi:hypothetical protein RSOLAG22IIIB_09986 [Rhizoctonia solani]|uniref:Uncharacterized protein n=1 Tax=Rhizoctonia solani TaxID=456999 RepID=A0A0K6G0C8_9AGAM|nr:hypothetical protein RSOLAG22IIIB_09986 [Rhizoctonia solani]